MSEYRTANLRQRNSHPEILIEVSSEFESGFEWLLSYFEEAVDSGMLFKDGQFVQFGWMIVTLRADQDGDLKILEPRFDAMPIQWIHGVNMTLRHLLIQREVCAQLTADPSFPSLMDSRVISDGLLGSEVIRMERETSKGGSDSGWLFRDPDAKGGRHCSLFEIAVSCPAVVPFLALPEGSAVSLNASEIQVSCGDRQIHSSSNAFLSKLQARHS